jgi:hypothetical protein
MGQKAPPEAPAQRAAFAAGQASRWLWRGRLTKTHWTRPVATYLRSSSLPTVLANWAQ